MELERTMDLRVVLPYLSSSIGFPSIRVCNWPCWSNSDSGCSTSRSGKPRILMQSAGILAPSESHPTPTSTPYSTPRHVVLSRNPFSLGTAYVLELARGSLQDSQRAADVLGIS